LRRTIRTLLILVVGVAVLGSVVPGSPTAHLPTANASTRSQVALANQRLHWLEHRITSVRRGIAHRTDHLHRTLPERPARPSVAGDSTIGFVTQWTDHLRAVHQWKHKTKRMRHRVQTMNEQKRKLVKDLVQKRADVRSWLAQWGILERCPLRGTFEIMDNFGVMVRIKGVPPHIHQGNDIIAPYGTPIIAPFDGQAVTATNELGGLAVKVLGPRGYVYNAHLERFGKLGAVQAGDVIGYVGATGDAGGPHDHFEWHPGNGAAVDPNPYLTAAC
jgi:murein DD-endopeptidase MepM/ murein hydrolase activator NlpD